MLPRDIQGDEMAAEAVPLLHGPELSGGDGDKSGSVFESESEEEVDKEVEYGRDDGGKFCTVPDDEDEDDGMTAAGGLSDAAADEPNGTSLSSIKAKRSRSGLPTWLPKEYREICATLHTEMENSPQGWPACYEASSFYHKVGKNPFFVLLTRSQLDHMMFWRPRYFVWFPHLFQQIPCPECLAAGRCMVRAGILTLSPYTIPKGPQHVYDVTDHVYIIGQRYHCQHSDCKKTYQSWSPAVLNVIPPVLAAQFTFHLSYRSGLTDNLAMLLRSNFQCGTGPASFSEMIRTFHIRRWEQLLQQYLEMVYSRADAVSVGLIALHETFGEWNDVNNTLMDKCMSMLTGRVMCLDLSFKVIKHLGKVDGVPIFGSFLSVVNEFGECRAMTLTMTKAHDQFMPTLAEIPHSLALYGHDDTEVVFTDNPKADKAELEQIIPALLHGIEPAPSSSLKPLIVPPEFDIFILGSLWLVNSWLEAFMDTVHALPKTKEFVIAMDMEWSVDRQTGIHGRVVLVTITFDRCVYLIPLREFLHDGVLRLPHALLVVLHSSRVVKYGVHVKADLMCLFHNCSWKDDSKEEHFVGGRELRAMAHKQGLATQANTSLADLSARVLQRSMSKEDSVHVSTEWDSRSLSKAHIDYAALDTYASWALYEALSAHARVASGQPVAAETPVATTVKLLSRDCSAVVAYGIVAPDRLPTFNGMNVMKTCILINLTSVLIPAYLVWKELLPSRVEAALSDVIAGGLPCHVLCCVKDLQTCPDSEERNATAASMDSEKDKLRPGLTLPCTTSPSEPPVVDTLSTGVDTSEATSEVELPAAAALNTTAHTITEASLDMAYKAGDEQKVEGSEADLEAMKNVHGLTSIVSAAAGASPVWSHVIGNIWHLMDQFKIPLHHGLRRPFLHALRDAILILDEDDKAALAPVLAAKKTTWDKMTFGPLKDAITGQPLFTKAMLKSAENILEHSRMGHYMDPPGVALYYPCGKDKDGLTLYRCICGMNNVEGRIHQNLAKCFGSYNVSPKFTWSLLRDYTLHHNLVVGTLNQTGACYNGSFDVWT
ncbi:hypothetical protein EWM64_g6866 [Hericium alpestre]|uniref:3'-5' exonuclease n=1 Tax=Hericium alpestre TaxID=135208 RepID=A0A4Y9ZSW5_9AGAM|nr:hypothetical protein EWM64_g6866 [Hericium alpestre]